MGRATAGMETYTPVIGHQTAEGNWRSYFNKAGALFLNPVFNYPDYSLAVRAAEGSQGGDARNQIHQTRPQSRHRRHGGRRPVRGRQTDAEFIEEVDV